MRYQMNDVTKIIIAGSRTFNDYELVRKAMLAIFGNFSPSQVEIISGHCSSGADHLGEVFAKRNGIPLTLFPADWNKYGRAAGPIRNKQMAEYVSSDGYLVAFWDGKSKGTKNMIEEAYKVGATVKIVRINCGVGGHRQNGFV